MAPMAARHYCNKTGCHSFAVPGSAYCEQHQRSTQRTYDRTRANDPAHTFYLSPQWRQVRAEYLSTHPVCEMCLLENRVVPAVLVHHRLEVTERPDLSLSSTNLVALCTMHHNQVHPAKGGNHDE